MPVSVSLCPSPKLNRCREIPGGQIVRDELPAVQRGVFQILPFLEHLKTRLELQRVCVAAADGRDLLLDLCGLVSQHGGRAKIDGHANRIQNPRRQQAAQPQPVNKLLVIARRVFRRQQHGVRAGRRRALAPCAPPVPATAAACVTCTGSPRPSRKKGFPFDGRGAVGDQMPLRRAPSASLRVRPPRRIARAAPANFWRGRRRAAARGRLKFRSAPPNHHATSAAFWPFSSDG